MIKKQVITGFLILLFLLSSTILTTVGMNINIKNEKQDKIKVDTGRFICFNEKLDFNMPSYSIENTPESKIITFEESRYKIIIGKNSGHTLSLGTSNMAGEGFNPGIDNIKVWFQEYDSDSSYLYYLWIINNTGDSYTFDGGLTHWVHFYGMYPNGTEVLLWSDGWEKEDRTVWETGECHGWLFYIHIKPDWEKPPQIKAVFEITMPEESPDTNLDDNVLVTPLTDSIKVDSHVQNFSGNPVEEAEVMYRPLTDHGFWFGALTNNKGNCVVPIPPKEPLDELLTYTLYAGKPFNRNKIEDSQEKTTEPVMEGQETDLEFELDVEGVKSKSKNKHNNLFLTLFQIFKKLLQQLFSDVKI